MSSQQQQMQQAQQQAFSQRNPIGQMPSMSMQGHSPSHSPGPSLNSSSGNKILPPSRSLSTSSMMPASSAPHSSNFPGFIGNQLNRNVGGSVGQVVEYLR